MRPTASAELSRFLIRVNDLFNAMRALAYIATLGFGPGTPLSCFAMREARFRFRRDALRRRHIRFRNGFISRLILRWPF